MFYYFCVENFSARSDGGFLFFDAEDDASLPFHFINIIERFNSKFASVVLILIVIRIPVILVGVGETPIRCIPLESELHKLSDQKVFCEDL